MNGFLLKVRRGDTPFYRRLRSIAQHMRSVSLPVPEVMRPLLGGLFTLCSALGSARRWGWAFFVAGPLFHGRCKSFGSGVHVSRIPWVVGHTEIYVGDNVNIFGKVDIFSGRVFDHPRLVLGNRVDLGHNVVFIVNKEIVLEEDVNVASGVRFMDTDAHPRDTMARIADLPPEADEIKPVRIGRYAWIGHNCFIMKGVTVGEGAIIGVNSVVVSDIPPYCVAMGNPARVVMKPKRPSQEQAEAANSAPAAG
jgi:acetyltransferase-like isoleucine patch superfamily enzyme